MILAGDIGGTNTRLGLFEPHADRPRALAVSVFRTLEYRDLSAIVSAFANAQAAHGTLLDSASFGVAGPVLGDRAELTNVPWLIDAKDIAKTFEIGRVSLLNDLQAMAYAVPALAPPELLVLQEGTPSSKSNMALIAAGTGLGETILHNVNGRMVPVASEGGHADFAARNERDIDLLRSLIRRFGHAELEQVVSGMGLVNWHHITHTEPCLAVEDVKAGHAPALISAAALERRCPGCVEALELFVEAYGAEAGNLALRSLAMGGVFIGGGIAPKIVRALTDGRFVRAFRDKVPPFDNLLTSIPIKVILNDEAGLLGAAIHASNMGQ